MERRRFFSLPAFSAALVTILVTIVVVLLNSSSFLGDVGEVSPQGPQASGMSSTSEAVRPAEEVRLGTDRQAITESAPANEEVTGLHPGPDSSATLTVNAFTKEHERLAGCRFVLQPFADGSRLSRDALSMAEIKDGVHLARGLPEGKYDLLCRQPYITTSLAVVAWSGKEDRELAVRVARRADLLGGVVQNVSGVPVKGAVVRNVCRGAREFFCITDQHGRFRFARAEQCTSDRALFLLTDDAGTAGIADSPSIELRWGDLERVITAKPRAEFVVRVTDRSGRRLERFEVQAECKTAHGRIAKSGAASRGIARVAGMPTGDAQLLVVPEPAWLPVRKKVEVAADGSGYAIMVTSQAALLEGVVSSAAGRLPKHSVLARLYPDGSGRGSPSGKPGAGLRLVRKASTLGVRCNVKDGRFVFGCDPSVTYRLQVEAPGHSPFMRTVQAVHGKFPKVNVRLQPTHTLHVRIAPPEAMGWLRLYRQQDAAVRRTAPFAMIQRDPLPGKKRTVLTLEPSSDAKLEFTDLSSGKWFLRLYSPFRPRLLAEVDLGSTEVVELPPIDLEDLRPGRVVGRLFWDEKKIRPRVLGVKPEDRRGMRVPVRADGSFDFHAPAGRYQLRVVVEPIRSGGTRLSRETLLAVTRTSPAMVLAGQTTQVSIQVALERLTIRLIDSRTGAAVPKVTLSIDEERAGREWRSVKTDESGMAVLYPRPLGEFGLSMLDETTSAWTHLTRVSVGCQNPLTVRIER